MACKFCMFVHEIDGGEDSDLYECRRHAPMPVVFRGKLHRDAQTEWGWPLVSSDDWCGEYRIE
jgi:hypothetical protein